MIHIPFPVIALFAGAFVTAMVWAVVQDVKAMRKRWEAEQNEPR